jgi:cytoskeletal protein RodZ
MRRKTKTKKPLLLLLGAILLAAVILWFLHNKSNNSSDKAETTKQGVPTSQSNADTSKGVAPPSSETDSEPPTATNPLPSSTLTINSFSQSGGFVRATATATNAQSGSCFFGFSSTGTKPVNRTVDSVTDGTSQKCNIEINEAEFTKLGAWTMNVIFTVGNSKVENSQNVTIN